MSTPATDLCLPPPSGRCREAEDEAQGLREEKESLMKTLRYLQEEFLRLDRAQSRRADAK